MHIMNYQPFFIFFCWRGGREERICCSSGENFVSKNCKELEIKALLRDELETYRYLCYVA